MKLGSSWANEVEKRSLDARGYVATLALGAQGISLGTRFLATPESNAHPTYKRKLIELAKTEYTDVFGRARWPGAPQRVLRTPFFNDWKSLPVHENEVNQPIIGHAKIHDRKEGFGVLLVLFQTCLQLVTLKAWQCMLAKV
ncbi:2-nitropropane dioxygenase-like protein [Quillaja saponaria]|uniref:2-nitropropane dioxygenase-like protein n=1 Tax=Quillaja saponaria TaxID=32244 RepID=A0AAD7KVC4_QUISA|nr:2-nitropropane dioxygenase-like protein [Quillaja saponaria]